jgi:RIO-like serine/threonine protein kinase
MSDSVPNYLFVKEEVSLREYKMYKYLHNMELPFIPKLYRYDKTTRKLDMQRIIGMSVADFYGEAFDCVPKKIISEIRNIIRYLYNIGVVYPDITGYNFIVDKNSKVWIIDFEHCFYINNLQNKNDIIFDKFDKFDNNIPDKDEHINFVVNFSFNNENNWNKYFM